MTAWALVFLERLNRGIDTTNNVSVSNFFYGNVGANDTRQVIIQSSQDAADQLVDVMRRSGYKITG